MSKKYKFNFSNGVGEVNDVTEIVELSEHLDENEIDLEFMEWFIDQTELSGIEGSWEEVSDE